MADRRQRSSMSMAGGASPSAMLERSSLFAGLDDAGLSAVALSMRPIAFATGEQLCRAGEGPDTMFVIINGLVHVHDSESGAQVARQRRGDVVGAMALAAGEPHTVTAVAAMPTETLALDAPSFEKLLDRHPVVLRNLNGILTRRLAASYVRAGHRGSARGEAVGLIVGHSLQGVIDDVLSATQAAAAQPLECLDTRDGFEQAMARLDDLLMECATVVVVARADGRSAPLLLDQVDRATVLTADRDEAERFTGAQRADLVVAGPLVSSALPVARAVDDPPAPADVAWLGRHLSGTKLGVALGAGGAKGYAHVGALSVLEQAGYTIDSIAGSSIGALVAAYVALGMNADQVERTLRERFTPDSVGQLFKLSLGGGSTGLELMSRLLRETTGDATFADTHIPLTIMTVDLTDRRPSPLREGPLWDALLAATALAGMFPPHERDGHRLVDGLALVPVPTGAVVEDGADVTVSVNLMGRQVLPAWPGHADPPPEPDRPSGSRILDNLLEVMDLSQMDTSIRHAEAADVPITPLFGPCSWRDFQLADRFLAAGREAAEQQLPALQALARPQLQSVST